MANKKKPVDHQIKIKVYMRDGFECTYCEKKIDNAHEVTVDHVIPRFHGGSNTIDNLTVSCKTCNTLKGHLLLTQFIKALDLKITKKMARFL